MHEPAGSIRSVQRAMQILGKFGTIRKSWGVMDLSRETGLHKSVVTRILATMAHEGFVVQDPESRAYSAGPKAFAVEAPTNHGSSGPSSPSGHAAGH